MAFPDPESLSADDRRAVLAAIRALWSRLAAELRRAAGAACEGAVALTPREIEILGWVEQGLTNADIATLCGRSIRTVHKHLENVFAKLNVENRGAAVRKWREL